MLRQLSTVKILHLKKHTGLRNLIMSMLLTPSHPSSNNKTHPENKKATLKKGRGRWGWGVRGGGSQKQRTEKGPVVQGLTIHGCAMHHAAPRSGGQTPECGRGWGTSGGCRKGGVCVESALPKAAFRPQSDCLWPRGMAETGAKFQWGESLSAYLQTG